MPLAPYLGDPALVNSNTAYVLPALPQNTETANATTVTDPLKICVDDIHFLAKQMSSYRPHIQMTATPDTITISPFFSVSVFDGTKWFFLSKPAGAAIAVANKEGGGNFTPGTAYYIYLKADATIVISADLPDTALLFKAAGASANQFRYLGRVIALNTTQFYTFNMIDYNYTMSFPLNTDFSGSFFQPVVNVDTDIGVGLPFPGVMKLLIQLASASDKADTLGNCMYLYLRPAGSTIAGTWTGFGVPRHSQSNAGVDNLPSNYATIEIPVNSSTGRIVATLNNLQGGALTSESRVKIWWTGWKE